MKKVIKFKVLMFQNKIKYKYLNSIYNNCICIRFIYYLKFLKYLRELVKLNL